MDKVRRIVHSKLKPFHFQIEWYYLFDANYQTDNPSHTDNAQNNIRSGIFYKTYYLSKVKIFQKDSLFHPEVILTLYFAF